MKSRFFRFMSAHVYSFMLFLPCVWIVLTAVGWSRDDVVEEDVTNIWVPTSGSFFDDKKYKDSIIGDDYNKLSAFLAMSKSRDGENLFTEERLKEIRQRMEDSEKTTVRVFCTVVTIFWPWQDWDRVLF